MVELVSWWVQPWYYGIEFRACDVVGLWVSVCDECLNMYIVMHHIHRVSLLRAVRGSDGPQSSFIGFLD